MICQFSSFIIVQQKAKFYWKGKIVEVWNLYFYLMGREYKVYFNCPKALHIQYAHDLLKERGIDCVTKNIPKNFGMLFE